MTREQFNGLLATRGSLIIDGALATELEVRCHDLNHPLWSARLLGDDPQAIEKVHLDYYLAGADIAITASYQASVQGLQEHFGLSSGDAESVIGTSVRLAQRAREIAKERLSSSGTLLVAGSVGPYGAYLADGSEYRGDYQRSATEFQEFHRPRIQVLVNAGVDLLAVETMPQLAEIEAVLELLQREFSNTICWISCTLKDSTHLSDGTPLQDLVKLIERYKDQVVAVGINCVPTHLVADALRALKSYTQLPLVCYPNSGETWDASTKTWSGAAASDDSVEDEVRSWQQSGAILIGGCCRTGPKFIEMVQRTCSLS